MEIILNGSKKELPYESCSLEEILKNLDITSKNLIVEVNLDWVKKEEYSKRLIKNGDQVELLHFIGGG